MLDTLRRHSKGWISKVLMGLLIVSFGIWGISDVFNRFVDRDVGKVGSARIGLEEFREVYGDRLRVLGSQVGRNISPEQARMLGIDRQILNEYIAETAFDQNARALGLAISDADLVQRIHSNPAFRGANGQFDANRFEQVLRSNSYSEARYLSVERRFALRQQIGRAVGGDILAPDTLSSAVRRYDSEERAIEFVTLNRAHAGNIPNPTPEEISNYFESRKASFRAPEYRKVVLLLLTPEALAGQLEVSQDDLKKAYEAQRERMSTPERREVEQILFPTMEEARTAAGRINAGTKFESVGAERSLGENDMKLGFVAKREMTDPAIANAAFLLAQGKISEPVQGRFGVALLRVNKIIPGREPGFAENADALRKQLTADRARRMILDLHDKIEDERASGSNVTETANKTGLKVTTIEAIDRSGRAPDGKPVENVPGLEQMLGSIFSTGVGTEADPVDLRSVGGYVWYEVASITPSRERTIDEIRERVVERWRDDEVAKRLADRAETLRQRLDANEKFETVAQGLKVEKRDKLIRSKPVDGIDSRTLAGLFETLQGKAGITVAEDGVGRVVYRVLSATLPAQSGPLPQPIAELGAKIQDDLLTQYVLHMQNQIGVSVNEAAFRNVTGATGN